MFEDAGITLGRNLFVLSASSQPDFLVLAGPAFKAMPYEEGVRKGFAQASKDTNQRRTTIKVSRHSYFEAAESMALRKYFCREYNSSTLQINKQALR